MIEDLEKTDDYLNLYLPFRIQKMIDDTLFTVTTNIEFKRLLEYEQTTFKNLMTNVKTLSSKLVKDECLVPSQEDRERVQRERNHQATQRMLSSHGGGSRLRPHSSSKRRSDGEGGHIDDG